TNRDANTRVTTQPRPDIFFAPPTALPVAQITPETIETAVAKQQQYMKNLANRFEREAKNLANLTGQNIQTIRQRISDEVPQPMPSLWLLQHPKST
ncbi:MAG: hypothetical protein ABG776_20750, partial [Cyanobacteria bacterium J06555_13]